MANPSIAMIPSGYKAGTLYNPIPNVASGDFNVVRNSIATRVNSDGLIETVGANVPRLDYTNGGCPVLLTEPQSTNVITDSNDFSASSWTKSNSSVVEGFTSPDGSSNAYKLVNNADASNKYIRVLPPATSGVDYSFSVFAKKGEYDRLRLEDGQNSRGAWFNLSNGTYSSLGTDVTAKIQDYGNGWYRCSITKPSITTAFFGVVAVSNVESINVGDGTSGAYIYGAQLEELSYATSYIPTSGSTLLRQGDVINGAGTSSDFNSSEGVLFLEGSALTDTVSVNNWISISDGTADNQIALRFETSSQIYGQVISGGTSQALLNFIGDYSQNRKYAIKWKLNDFTLWVDGIEILADNSGAVPIGLNSIQFNYGSGGNNFYGNTSQVQVFKSALTDLEIETLVSWSSFLALATNFNYNII